MRDNRYRLFLYKPAAAAYVVDNANYRAEFIGELKADNVSVEIRLQEISTLSFDLPENILGTFNTRLNEVLEGYIVELWYGDLTGALGADQFPANGDRIRFTIVNSRLEYQNGVKKFCYDANSIEHVLEFKQLLKWPGIKIKDFYRKISYDAAENEFTEVAATGQTIPSHPYQIQTSTNTRETKYITIATTTAGSNPPSPFDIFIYQYRRNDTDTVNSENSVIEYTGTSGVNNEFFKPGFYVPTLDGNGKVTALSISLPDDLDEFDAADTNFEIFVYDNPASRHFAIGVNTDEEIGASDMYLDLAQDAEDGDAAEYGNYAFTTQEVYSINGLKLEHILLGTQESRTGGSIDNTKLTTDGVLYDTGFTIGTIQADIAAKYRSNIELNNITKYEAIKTLAESFDCIAVFNTIENTISFYPDKNEEVFTNRGLIITKDNYLKNINNSIDAKKIITKAYGAGKDNIGLELITPNGGSAWEDYSYFLDTYYVEYDRDNLLTIQSDETTGIVYGSFPTGTTSRWMDSTQALNIAKWQYARDYFHDVMLGLYNPTGDPDIGSHSRYYNLYNLRSEAINEFVKEETKYFEFKAQEYRYKYLYEYYVKLNKSGGNAESEAYEDDYEIKYNDAVSVSTEALAALDRLHYEIYNTKFDGTIDDTTFATQKANSFATKILEVQGFLDKSNWSINTTKIKAFEKDAIMSDSKLDNELDLLNAVQEFVKENCRPIVTIDVDVVDILGSEQSSTDWDKIKIGDVVNIYYPDFNIDTTAQLREISIDFQSNALKFVISTYRQYGRLPLQYIAREVRRAYDVETNQTKFKHDENKVANARAFVANKKLERIGFAAEQSPIKLGAKGSDGSTSTEISGEGFVSKVIGVNPVLETFTYSTGKTLQVADGTTLAKNTISETLTSEVEVSGDNGFVIRSINSGTVTTQAYIDPDGNAVFGPLYINNLNSSTQAYTIANGGLTADPSNDDLVVPYGPDQAIYTLAKGVYVDNLTFTIANYTPDVLLTISIYNGATKIKYVPVAITGNGTITVNNINSFVTKIQFDLAAVGGSATITTSSISANYYLPTVQLNDLTISSKGQVSTNEALFGQDTKDKILIKSDESASVTNPAQIILTTPTTALTADTTIRFPSLSGTIALVDAAQTWTGNQTFSNNVIVTGNFTVNGTTTTLNSTTLTIDDKNIVLGSVASPSDSTADGGGITLKGTTDKTINWIDSTDSWTSSEIFSAPNFVSTVATGTQPYATTSTTLNTNLNADLLDGNHAAAFSLSGHTHDDRYYTETETDNLLNAKANLSGATFTGTLGVSQIDMGATGVINFNQTAGTVSKIVGFNNGIDFYSDDPIRFMESDGSVAAVTMSLNAGTVTATRFISTQTTGTAPFTVASTTLVTNLNADKLDGNDASAFSLDGHTHALNDLSDVSGTPSNGQVLKYSTIAGGWIPQDDNNTPDTNTYVTSAAFNTGTGVLTLTRNDAATVTVDLDGKYAEASTALTTSTSFGGDVSGTYNAIAVDDDSHYHSMSTLRVPNFYRLVYSTTTTMSDPGISIFRFNNATISSATQMVIDDIDYDTRPIDIFVPEFTSGILVIYGTDSGNNDWDYDEIAKFYVNSVTDNAGYTTLNISHIDSSASAISNNDICLIQFIELPKSTSKIAGGIKSRLDGTTLYLRNDGSDA